MRANTLTLNPQANRHMEYNMLMNNMNPYQGMAEQQYLANTVSILNEGMN